MGRSNLPAPEFLSLTYTLPFHLVAQLNEVAEASNRSQSEVVADSIRLYLKAWAARTEQTRISTVDGFSYQEIAVGQALLDDSPATATPPGEWPDALAAGTAPTADPTPGDEPQPEAHSTASDTAPTGRSAAEAGPEPAPRPDAAVESSAPAVPEPTLSTEKADLAASNRPSARELLAQAAARIDDRATPRVQDGELPAAIADPGKATRRALLKLADEPLDSPKLSGELQAIMRRVDVKDYSSPFHSVRVAELAVKLAKAKGLHGGRLREVEMAALAHDIGKACIPEEILAKPRPAPEEMALIRKYPELGAELLGAVPSLAPILPVVETHQERWNGSGYPDGRQGPDIPLAAQIVALCDVYEVLTNERRYRPAYSEERAHQIIAQSAGTLWNPELVQLFVRKVLAADAQAAGAAVRVGIQETR